MQVHASAPAAPAPSRLLPQCPPLSHPCLLLQPCRRRALPADGRVHVRTPCPSSRGCVTCDTALQLPSIRPARLLQPKQLRLLERQRPLRLRAPCFAALPKREFHVDCVSMVGGGGAGGGGVSAAVAAACPDFLRPHSDISITASHATCGRLTLATVGCSRSVLCFSLLSAVAPSRALHNVTSVR